MPRPSEKPAAAHWMSAPEGVIWGVLSFTPQRASVEPRIRGRMRREVGFPPPEPRRKRAFLDLGPEIGRARLEVVPSSLTVRPVLSLLPSLNT